MYSINFKFFSITRQWITFTSSSNKVNGNFYWITKQRNRRLRFSFLISLAYTTTHRTSNTLNEFFFSFFSYRLMGAKNNNNIKFMIHGDICVVYITMLDFCHVSFFHFLFLFFSFSQLIFIAGFVWSRYSKFLLLHSIEWCFEFYSKNKFPDM